MREKSSSFGQRRPDQQKELPIKTRYFLACEGEKTEKCYFKGFYNAFIKETKTKLIILYDLNSISPRPKGYSHPKQVFEQVFEFQKWLIKMKYNRRDDKACIIVDRDHMSFTDEQYTKMVSDCKKRKFQFYVTNPRFEFWLLLHFCSKDQLKLERIRAPYKSGEEHYIEKCLHQYYPHFNKSRYNFTYFKDKVLSAIENEKGFYEDLDQLKDNIGCNIGILLTELMK